MEKKFLRYLSGGPRLECNICLDHLLRLSYSCQSHANVTGRQTFKHWKRERWKYNTLASRVEIGSTSVQTIYKRRERCDPVWAIHSVSDPQKWVNATFTFREVSHSWAMTWALLTCMVSSKCVRSETKRYKKSTKTHTRACNPSSTMEKQRELSCDDQRMSACSENIDLYL